MDDIFFSTRNNSSKANFFNRLLNILFYFSIILFFIGFNFSDSPPFGWYQQFLPNLNGRSISDIVFLDSLTGLGVTPYTVNDTAYIIKTTNGGDNWMVIFRQSTNTVGGFNRIQFINQTTGFACGNFLWKTTNAGINWFNINTSGIFPENMHVLNQDTIWIIDSESLTGGVFRTTNGGLNWTRQLQAGSQNPEEIYMFNARIGFIVKNYSGAINLRKTTNSGLNWFTVLLNEGFRDMYFVDSLTGWKSTGHPDTSMKKTTDGGLTWYKQILPHGGIISNLGGILRFSNVNRDTIWGAGNYVIYPNGQVRPFLYRTTNGGNNWAFQIPDTSIVHLFAPYYFITFVNKSIGWAYYLDRGIHTVTGGDTTFLSSVRQISNEVPKDYKLFQNYPNPFNPISVIRYQVLRSSDVKLIIYNITGKEITTLANERKSPGTYEAAFDGSNLSSGVYFYTLFINGIMVDTKKAVLIK